jgi:hypothetical protein
MDRLHRLGCETCCLGEGLDGVLVGAVGCLERSGRAWCGQVGQAGGEQSVVDGGQEPGGAQAGAGDLVAATVRDAGDQAMQA